MTGGGKKSWFADKPGSVRRQNFHSGDDGHLSTVAIACDLEQSTRESSEPGRLARLLRRGRTIACPLFDLASSGVYRADRVTSIAGELLPHRFTLTTRQLTDRSAVYFLLHCP